MPVENLCTDAEVQALKAEREWARDLADKFDTTGQASHPVSTPAGAFPDEERFAVVEATVRRMSCATEFKYRKRPTWFYIGGCLVALHLPASLCWIASEISGAKREAVVAFLALGAFTVFTWFVLWWRAMPICPNCKQNIRFCPAEHCHVCGKWMSHGRCIDCGVDTAWTGWLHPSSNGHHKRITFCPGCGAQLGTWIRRWHPAV